MTAEWRSGAFQNGSGPLRGLKVLEFSHVLAGSIAGLMLADMGADVIKVERPPKGDSQRWDVADEDSIGPYSASFGVLNRNKRSIMADLKNPADVAAIQTLVEGADVLVHNYRIGVLDKLGLGFAALHARLPKLVYCSISGFGATGPWSNRGGFDLVAQAMSGIMSFTGAENGAEPVKCGPPITDIATGILASTGILAALHRQKLTGIGEHVETSLLEAGVMFTFIQSAISMASGMTPVPMGSAHPLYAPYEVFQAADGWVALGTANEANWRRLVDMLGSPELADDPRFSTTSARVLNRALLKEKLSVGFATAPRDVWVERLTAANIPCGPLLSVPEMLQHPQVLARDMVVTVEGAGVPSHRAIGCPVKFSDSGLATPAAAPLLNAHS